MSKAKPKSDRKHLLLLAGRVANAARALVGGDGFNGRVAAAHLDNLSAAAQRLRTAVDEYDRAIMDTARKKP